MKAHLLLPLFLLLPGARSLTAQETAFTYQGRLTDSGSPATGYYDLRLILFTTSFGGNQIGPVLTNANVAVGNGLFTTPIDFGGGILDGSPRWLEIAVRPNASLVDFLPLDPRQPVTPAPHALYAQSAGGLATFSDEPLEVRVNGQRVLRFEPGTVPNLIGGDPGNSASHGVVGATIGGGGGSGVLANRVTDNHGTVSGGLGNRAGDGNGSAFDQRFATVGGGYFNVSSGSGATVSGGVSNLSSGPLAAIGGGESNAATNRWAVISGGVRNTNRAVAATIGGGSNNCVQTIASGAVIAGGCSNWVDAGGYYASIHGGADNSIGTNSGASTIGGGIGNEIGDNARNSAILGGDFHVVEDGAVFGLIGGGEENRIGAGAAFSAILCGQRNSIASNSTHSIIGCGDNNIIDPRASGSMIGGGTYNRIGTTSYDCFIGGGFLNKIGTNATYCVVGGGQSNTNLANATYATIPGGTANAVGGRSSFAAGYRAKAVHSGSFVWGDSTEANVTSTAEDQFTVRASGGVRFFSSTDPTAGVQLAPGGTGWSAVSDRNLKEHFQPVDSDEVLRRVLALPVQTWNMKTQDPAIRHIGAMAQDFRAAFQVGEDERHINSVDADGVALAAIQGLHKLVQRQTAELRTECREKDAQIDELKRRLAAVEELVSVWTKPCPLSKRAMRDDPAIILPKQWADE